MSLLNKYGITTEFPAFGGSDLPTSGALRFVCNRTGVNAGDGKSPDRPYSTLASALADSAVARTSSAGRVYAMPGHSESTATTVITGLVAGTQVIGLGDGSLKPVIRLTATGAQLAVSVAGVTFENIRFRLEGANGVVKAIVVTGADVTFKNCEFEVASGASNKSTIALEIGTGGDRCRVINCVFRGTVTHNVTDCIKLAGTADQVTIAGCEMVASATAANGLIRITGASTNVKILYNTIHNTHTSSTACIKVDDVASTGLIVGNVCATENDGTATAQGIVFAGTTNTTIKCAQNFSVDEKGKSGVLTPAAVAT